MPAKSSLQEFIVKAHKVHADKYDYSNVLYDGNNHKVCIVCPDHGKFWQTPGHHLMGQGCPSCGRVKIGLQSRISKEDFIAKARKIHGNKYEYSKVDYKGHQVKVCIVCPEHGEFWQAAGNHLSGNGCPKCKNHYSPTTQEFIERARKIHGEKYDYSKTIYVKCMDKVCITCPTHGDFWQTPNQHLQGDGCAACAGVKKLTTEEFVAKSILKHGDKYDYSKVIYSGNKEKVCIICPIHGEFWQKPNQHLSGSGCPLCGREIQGRKKITKEQFLAQACEKHGDKYDYSQVDYKGQKEPVCIICPTHGEFWQTPSNHIRTKGCPKCSSEFRAIHAIHELAVINQSRGEKSARYRRLSLKELPLDIQEKIIEQKTRTFIEKAIEVHGDKYNYSKVRYIESREKVCIICPDHGEFWQTPGLHINQQCGCRKCANAQKNMTRRVSTEIMIERFRKVHGEFYDYSKVKYVSSTDNICIICPKHGEFWQRPYNHLKGSECPECDKEKKSKIFRKTTEQFIKEAREVHGDRYDYSKVDYISTGLPVCIICKEHGEFWQTPGNHLRGADCMKCAYIENGENCAKGFDDFVEKAREIHGDKYDYSLAKDVYKRRMDLIPIICPEHGEYWQVAMYHLCGNACPVCSESQLERIVRLCLERHNIKYEMEKKFSWLKYKGPMFLDFYLPEYKIAIECQGIQHFQVSDFYGGEAGFEYTKDRDSWKREVCEKHKIRMLYFSNLHIDYPYNVIEDTNTLLQTIKGSGQYRSLNPCRQLTLQFDD